MLVLDTGGVLALSRRDREAMAVYRYVVERRTVDVVIPMPVVVEAVRGDGPRDAGVNRVLAEVDALVPLDEPLAREAGRLWAAVGGGSTSAVDAVVAAVALRSRGLAPTVIMTSDPKDLGRLVGDSPYVNLRVV